MTGRSEAVTAAFERWGPSAFQLGALGLLGLAILGSLDVAGVASTSGSVHTVLLVGGVWCTFVGLLGLAPGVRAPAPRLGLAGAVTAALGFVVLSGTLGAATVVAVATERTFAEPGPWAPPLLLGGFVLVLLTCLLLGVGALRTERPSRTAGWLLLVPVLAFLGEAAMLALKIGGETYSAAAQLGLAAVAALALFALGSHLGGLDRQTARPSASEPVS